MSLTKLELSTQQKKAVTRKFNSEFNVSRKFSLGLSLTKLELSTQQKQTAHKTDRFVENDVGYEQNYAARVRGFVQYNNRGGHQIHPDEDLRQQLWSCQ